MAKTTDQIMPPKPEVEFDFDLPQGIDTEEFAQSNEHDSNDPLSDHEPIEDVQRVIEPNIDQDENSVCQIINYNMHQEGLSDDDHAPEAFDRSWSAHQARKSLSRKRKSPRAKNGNDEASPSSKKPRQSLFGSTTEEVEEDQFADIFEEQTEDRLVDQAGYSLETPIAKHNIDSRMSSFNLGQQEMEANSSKQLFNLGFGLEDSGGESMSPRASPALSDSEIVIPADTQPAYELRQNIDRKATYTYVDQDESGNFDPAHETENHSLKLKQAKAAKAAKSAHQLKKGKQRTSEEPVMKYIVRLRFRRFGNVRNATNDEENWPEGWSDIDSEAEREMQEYRGFFRRNTPNRDMQLPIQDPRSEVEDLTGHPVARGCISCRTHGIDCSLVVCGTYPCQDCCDADQDCEPIIPPTEKGRCKQCVDDNNDTCSFESEPSQAICDHCAENEHICEALPPVGYRAKRIIIDEVIYTENRAHIQCTNCRQEKKRCSLKKKTDKPPCKHCKKHNIGCTFYDIPKVIKEKKGKVKGPTEGDAPEVAVPDHDYFTKEDLEDMYMEDLQTQSRSPTPELEMEDDAGHKGKLTKIKTSFAHPIQFGAIVNTSDCNFCEMPTFGLVGLFEKEVHVIRWYNGSGYTEVGGGHTGNGNDATTMCQSCTFGRAQTIDCPRHDVQHISPNGKVPDFDEVFADLLGASESPTETKQQLQRWCSMCFFPATFVCRTRQVSLLSAEDAEEEIDGCGLRLCVGCGIKLREIYDGDSSRMAEELDREPKAKADDEGPEDTGLVRADVGFLSENGLLMKSLANVAEEANF